MKRILLASAVVFAASSAFAADAVVYQDPAPVVADTFSWTGGYIGVNAGYAGGRFKATAHDYEDPSESLTIKNNASGFIGGVQAGYNWQFDRTVIGIETDIQASGLKSEISLSDDTDAISLGTKINWFGTTRARLGYAATDRFLVYATGGIAYGKVKSYANAFDEGVSYSKNKTGYTVGAGAEYAITDNVTFKTEYLYTDLGKLKIDLGDDLRVDVKSQFHTVRAGLNYKF